MKWIFKSESERDTKNLANLFAQEILETKPGKGALVIGLVGDLGAGKTAFIKSLLRALGVKARVVSPTFILFRRYILPKSRLKPRQPKNYTFFDDRQKRYNLNYKNIKNVWHVDAYRISSAKEFLKLGLTEVFSNPQNLVLVEWADKIKRILPKGTIWIEFKHGAKSNERHITFNRR